MNFFKYLYELYYNYRYNPLKVKNNGFCKLKYIIGLKEYVILIKHRSLLNDNRFCIFFDDLNNDITQKIIPYLGPNFDWHNQLYTPKILGYNKLIIKKYEHIMIFNENDVINIT